MISIVGMLLCVAILFEIYFESATLKMGFKDGEKGVINMVRTKKIARCE